MSSKSKAIALLSLITRIHLVTRQLQKTCAMTGIERPVPTVPVRTQGRKPYPNCCAATGKRRLSYTEEVTDVRLVLLSPTNTLLLTAVPALSVSQWTNSPRNTYWLPTVYRIDLIHGLRIVLLCRRNWGNKNEVCCSVTSPASLRGKCEQGLCSELWVNFILKPSPGVSSTMLVEIL